MLGNCFFSIELVLVDFCLGINSAGRAHKFSALTEGFDLYLLCIYMFILPFITWKEFIENWNIIVCLVYWFRVFYREILEVLPLYCFCFDVWRHYFDVLLCTKPCYIDHACDRSWPIKITNLAVLPLFIMA